MSNDKNNATELSSLITAVRNAGDDYLAVSSLRVVGIITGRTVVAINVERDAPVAPKKSRVVGGRADCHAALIEKLTALDTFWKKTAGHLSAEEIESRELGWPRMKEGPTPRQARYLPISPAMVAEILRVGAVAVFPIDDWFEGLDIWGQNATLYLEEADHA